MDFIDNLGKKKKIIFIYWHIPEKFLNKFKSRQLLIRFLKENF